MPRPITDKMLCRVCRRRPPDVEIRHAKGKPLGECMECHRRLQLQGRLKRSFALGLYQSLPELVAANLKTLATLKPGFYRLVDVTTKGPGGFVACKTGQVYVNAWNNEALFRRQWFEVASYIGNHGLLIESDAIDVLGSDGQPVSLEEVGLGLPLEDPAERLVWYDRVLQAKALKLIREELRTIKRETLAKSRRSNNPKSKPSTKPAE